MGITLKNPDLPAITFMQIFLDDSHKNVRISTCDGTLVFAHSAVLAVISDKLRDIFSRHNFGMFQIDTPNVTCITWEIILKFIHTGSVTLPAGYQISRLVEVSEALRLKPLQRYFSENNSILDTSTVPLPNTPHQRQAHCGSTSCPSGHSQAQHQANVVSARNYLKETTCEHGVRPVSNASVTCSNPRNVSFATPALHQPETENRVEMSVDRNNNYRQSEVDKVIDFSNMESTNSVVDLSDDSCNVVDEQFGAMQDSSGKRGNENYRSLSWQNEETAKLTQARSSRLRCSQNPAKIRTRMGRNKVRKRIEYPQSCSKGIKVLRKDEVVYKSERCARSSTRVNKFKGHFVQNSSSGDSSCEDIAKINVHLKKKYQCSTCKKTFVKSQNLHTHTRYCGKAKPDLSKHQPCRKAVNADNSLENLFSGVLLDSEDSTTTNSVNEHNISDAQTQGRLMVKASPSKVKATEKVRRPLASSFTRWKPCDTCHRRFNTEWDYMRHVKRCEAFSLDEEESIDQKTCMKCSKVFRDRANMHKHVRLKRCKFRMQPEKKVRKRQIRAAKYSCKKCHKVFAKPYNVRRHQERCPFRSNRKQRESLPVQNSQTNYISNNKKEEKSNVTHINRNGQPITFHHFQRICYICGHESTSAQRAGDHLSTVHMVTFCFICKHCSVGFKKCKALRDHIQNQRCTKLDKESSDSPVNYLTRSRNPKVDSSESHSENDFEDLVELTCADCGHVSETADDAAMHLSGEHDVIDCFVCKVCHEGYDTYMDFVGHAKFCQKGGTRNQTEHQDTAETSMEIEDTPGTSGTEDDSSSFESSDEDCLVVKTEVQDETSPEPR